MMSTDDDASRLEGARRRALADCADGAASCLTRLREFKNDNSVILTQSEINALNATIGVLRGIHSRTRVR